MINDLKGKKIGFGLTGSHSTYHKVFPQMEKLKDMGADVIPIVSYTVKNIDTKFGKATDHIEKIESITGKKIISTIPEAEPLGPENPLDLMILAPLTGYSLSKFANGLTDSAPLMAAKSTLRNQSPVLIGMTTNDALGLNGVNLMRLVASKLIYFVPFGQDDPYGKPNSLVSNLTLLPDSVVEALNLKQKQPIIVPFHDENMIK